MYSFLKSFIYSDAANDEATSSELYKIILKELKQRGYRKNGNYLFEQIIENGNETRYWEKKIKIDELIPTLCDRFKNPENWKLLTRDKNVLENVTQQIMNTVDLNTVKKDRHVISFKNGIYMMNKK